MKCVLVGINAKFIHSCLAVYSLKEYAKNCYDIDLSVEEYTINQSEDLILSEIFKKKPQMIAFSCYIWNYEIIKRLTKNLKKILPNVKIVFGGPEVSFDGKDILRNIDADFIICGEGEEAFSRLYLALKNNTPLHDVPSLVYKENGEIKETLRCEPIDMAKLPFVYKDLKRFENRILYYEAQRGCPFNCQYCLSSVDKGVRFQPIEKVKEELLIFLQNKVRQVKFVDRTFNANAKFAMGIWEFLNENDNGITNFHFEIASNLITDEMIEFLKTVRSGLFQFEIGVQSTNEKTLSAIDRKGSFKEIKDTVTKLKENKNIHLHLDLIAGLPFEDFNSFKNSFNDVYSLSPNQFQLGFLKLLKGSGLKRDAKKYGLVCRDTSPYEVLYTSYLSYGDMLRLKQIEELLETYYNSNRFQKAIEYVVSLFKTPFDFFESFSEFYQENNEHLRPHSKVEQYDILYEFSQKIDDCDKEYLRWLIKFDLYSHEKAKKLPAWLNEDLNGEYREEILSFYQKELENGKLLKEYTDFIPKQVLKMAHIEVFPFNPINKRKIKTALLFNYKNVDILGNATVTEIII